MDFASTSDRRLSIVSRLVDPDFLDLSWELPLIDWTHPRMATVARGISRHTVRFVRYDDQVFALKETEYKPAETEYRMLRVLHDDFALPTVEPVAVVSGRVAGTAADVSGDTAPNLGAVIITRYLDFSLPYRYLFGSENSEPYRQRLLDALVVLLVRLHLHGVVWGDCSLSNTLFRRDAGSLAAYLVDAETSESHPSLSEELRLNDVEIGCTNIAGGLYDLLSEGRLPVDVDPVSIVDGIQRRYNELWSELTRVDELDPSERFRIDQRVARINQLGFDIGEIAIERSADGSRLWIKPIVVEEGHHHRVLLGLTGLSVQENQAQRLLGAMTAYGAWLEATEHRKQPTAVRAYRWLSERYEPLLEMIPEELSDRLEPAELYIKYLDHRVKLNAAADHDLDESVSRKSFLESEIAPLPSERHLSNDEVG